MCSMHAWDTLAHLFFSSMLRPYRMTSVCFSHHGGGPPLNLGQSSGASRNVRRFWRSTRPIRFDSSLSRGLWQSGYVARPDKSPQGFLFRKSGSKTRKSKEHNGLGQQYHVYIMKYGHIVWYSRWIHIFVFFWRHLAIGINILQPSKRYKSIDKHPIWKIPKPLCCPRKNHHCRHTTKTKLHTHTHTHFGVLCDHHSCPFPKIVGFPFPTLGVWVVAL